MQLLKSLVTLALISVLTRAIPIASDFPVELSERELDELISRAPPGGSSTNTLYPPHGSYNKGAAVAFVKSIPNSKLDDGGARGKQGTIHSSGPGGHRLDHQGTTAEGLHNLQVQINGKAPKGVKTTVGAVLTDGNLSGKRLKGEITHAVMHPPQDKSGNHYVHYATSGGRK